MESDINFRPYRALVYLSDGVTYNNYERTLISLNGINYFKIRTYAVGIAIPKTDNQFGLSEWEVNRQKNQLLAIAQNKESNVFNLGGSDSFSVLFTIISQLGQLIKDDVGLSSSGIEQNYCGFAEYKYCLSNYNCPEQKKSRCCRWIPNPSRKNNIKGLCVNK